MAGTKVKDKTKYVHNKEIKQEEQLALDDTKELSEEDKKLKEALLKSYRYLLFETDGEQYGINIEYVSEIIGIQDITHLPKMPRFVKGLINLRGKIIPVIDAREKFGKHAASQTRPSTPRLRAALPASA